jgi:antitoxin component of MazEF toxin-antitoxin module
MRRKITTSGNSAALLLSQDVLGLMGVRVGDEVDVSLVDRTLVVRPIAETERATRVAEVVESVYQRRRGLLRRLAKDDVRASTATASKSGKKPRRR